MAKTKIQILNNTNYLARRIRKGETQPYSADVLKVGNGMVVYRFMAPGKDEGELRMTTEVGFRRAFNVSYSDSLSGKKSGKATILKQLPEAVAAW